MFLWQSTILNDSKITNVPLDVYSHSYRLREQRGWNQAKNVCFLHLDVTTTNLLYVACCCDIYFCSKRAFSVLPRWNICNFGARFLGVNTLWSKYSDKFQTTIDVGKTWKMQKIYLWTFSIWGKDLSFRNLSYVKLVERHIFFSKVTKLSDDFSKLAQIASWPMFSLFSRLVNGDGMFFWRWLLDGS